MSDTERTQSIFIVVAGAVIIVVIAAITTCQIASPVTMSESARCSEMCKPGRVAKYVESHQEGKFSIIPMQCDCKE